MDITGDGRERFHFHIKRSSPSLLSIRALAVPVLEHAAICGQHSLSFDLKVRSRFKPALATNSQPTYDRLKAGFLLVARESGLEWTEISRVILSYALDGRGFHGKESSPLEAIRELG